MTPDFRLHPDEVRGFLAQEEGQRLYDEMCAVSHLGDGLEVGSYCGKSTLWLGEACRAAGAVLFAVDHHLGSEEHQRGEEYHDPDLYDSRYRRMDSFPAFRDTLLRAGLDDAVIPVVAPSALVARAWAAPLALVFIDGGHSLEAAEADYSGWSPHIVSGGRLLIHDIFLDPADGGQAPRTIYERALESGDYEALEMTGTLGVLCKL